jgi:hypothetical protein
MQYRLGGAAWRPIASARTLGKRGQKRLKTLIFEKVLLASLREVGNVEALAREGSHMSWRV